MSKVNKEVKTNEKQTNKPKTQPKRTIRKQATFPLEDFVNKAYDLGYKPEMVMGALLSYSAKEEYTKAEFDKAMKDFTKNLK